MAQERKTGARGLRSIIENALLSAMFEIPSRKDVARVVVKASTMRDGQAGSSLNNGEEEVASAPPFFFLGGSFLHHPLIKVPKIATKS